MDTGGCIKCCTIADEIKTNNSINMKLAMKLQHFRRIKVSSGREVAHFPLYALWVSRPLRFFMFGQFSGSDIKPNDFIQTRIAKEFWQLHL